MIRSFASFLFPFALAGAALAQGDARFCSGYAANASGIGDAAIKKNPACLDYGRGVHGNFNSHFDWCMKNSPSSVQGAEANIRRLVSACTGNAAAPAPAQQPAANANMPASNTGAAPVWITVDTNPNKPMDPRARAVGQLRDGWPIFVCVAEHRGGSHPGMYLWPLGCALGFGGKEVKLQANVKVLASPARWAPATPGVIPPNAIATGSEKDGQALYSCRVRHEQELYVGKTRAGFNGCNFAAQGREITLARYDVLVQ